MPNPISVILGGRSGVDKPKVNYYIGSRMHTLVIIDMQGGFKASKSRPTIRSIIQQIRLSKSYNWPIVVVEFEEFGKTLYTLRRELEGYDKVRYVTKDKEDGSDEIYGALRELTKCLNLRICGVNTDQCVYSTVRGLRMYEKYRINVWSPGTNSEESHEHGIYLCSKLARIGGKLVDKRLKAA